MFSSEDSRIGRTRVSVIAVPARAGSALAASAPAVSAGYLGARRPRRFAGPIALAAALAALATALAPTLTGSAASHHGISAAERQRVASAYARLPLSFEENRGQSDSRVRFLAHGPGYGLFFTSGGPVLALRHSKSARSEDVVGLRFLGGNPDPSLSGVGRLPGTADYLIGSDRSRWRTGLPTFSGMRYQDLWPGVGVEFYGNASRLEYDLHLAPGADPARVGFSFVGARSLRLMASGGLSIGLPHGSLDQARPFAYQWLGSRRQPVSVGYAIAPGGRVGLRLGAYDHRRALIVDPGLIYSTYLGGSGSDFGKGIAVDASGDAYVTGSTLSSNFPTSAGAFQTTSGGNFDAFVTKLNASGSALVYSTYLGGSGSDFAQGVAVDTSGDAYVTGYTESSNFPTTAGAFQTTFGGSEDAFVTKLNATGSALIYSTYLGGSGYDTGLGIAVDAGGDAYVTGRTYSSKFPTTAGAFQTTSGGGPNAFVTKLNATGSALVYSTYLGGTNEDFGQGIAVDASGDAYVTGHTSSSNFPTTAGAFRTTEPGQINTFVTKLNASGSALVYSTYLGGNKVDVGTGITVDASGDAYVTGHTSSSNFPTSAGAFQTSLGGFQNAFVTKLNATGSALIYSTYLGGSGGDEGSGIAIDASDDAYVTGGTSSSNFPTTASAFQTSFGGGSRHAFVTKLNASGSALIYSTYLGGSGADFGKGIAIDASDDAYVTGYTESSNFPTTAGAFQTTSGGGSDAFVTKIVPTAATQTPPATLTVCESGPPTCEYATIQEAIDHIPPASNGATIQIAAGTYGGFVVSGGNVSLTSVTLEGAGAGKTTIRGGGPVVTIKSRAPVTITGVTISGGSNTGFGDRGGGILNSGTLTLTNSTVSGNTAYVGGGIFNSGTLTLTKSTVSENTAEDGSSGIANQGALTLTSSKVSSNTVTNASGGGISNGGTVTLTNSTVSGNTARHEAGGIFNFYGTVTLTNSTVSENTAKEEGGGGIYNEGGTETLTNSAVSGNTAGHQGGGIYGSGFGAVTLTNSAVSGNTACCSRGYLNPNGGGGIYNSSISTLTLTNSKVGDNSAALGGGIENEGSLGTVTLEDSKVSGNHANGGGGIFTYFGTLTLTNSSVSDNTAEGSGGGIDNVFGTPTLIRSHVSGNAAAEEGGGILNYRNEGTATLENSTVGDNSARSGSGIDNAYAGRMTLKNSVVSGNTAKEGGGGIHNGEEARMTLAKSTVSDNRAESGGGIYNAGHGFFTSGTLTLEKSSVSGNTAGARGGGIDDASGSPTLENSIVTGNRASEGGGVYSEGATTLKQTAVALNAATDGGGVFLNHGSTLALAQTVIVFNTATEKGGGIFNRGDVTGIHSAVFANIAKEGSGIFNEGGAVTLEESFVQP